jgi:glycolate oxidase FAD binding subunit
VGVTVADPVLAMAAEVGTDDAVTCVGGRTQWDVGGPVATGAREVGAPRGIVAFQPEEMTVRVRAGTTVVALDDELAGAGQTVALPDWEGATVGGVLAVGHSGLRRLGWGPVRDALLEARYVSAEGRVVKAGGPTVKNVSGFDLCRLLVGSLGTIGFLAELVLRTRPRPEAAAWSMGDDVDPFVVLHRLHRPATILWDGATTWVQLDGRAVDVAAQSSVLAAMGFASVDGRPPVPPHRTSVAPGELRAFAATRPPGSFLAEVGIGTVHLAEPGPAPTVDPKVAALNIAIKQRFDPDGRLNPGRDPQRA